MHVNKYHKISLINYRKDYILKSGGLIFPTYFDYLCNNKVFESVTTEIKDNTDQAMGDKDLISPTMLSSESE